MMLEVEDLKMYFPVQRGLLRRVGGYVEAVDGVSFVRRRGGDPGARGRVGLRQNHRGQVRGQPA